MKNHLSDIHRMHIGKLDMNLLRVFDAVYRSRSVNRASDDLGLSQPATSQALSRLRVVLKDALFVRVQGGVEPTPKAQRLAPAIRLAISTLENALLEAEEFDAQNTGRTFHLHLTDSGEALFLPRLVAALAQAAPQIKLHSLAVPQDEIAAALDTGRLDFAIGFLPALVETQSVELLRDRYIVLLRREHPMSAGDIGDIDFVAVRPHSETTRILQTLGLAERVKLTVSHFLALPEIIQGTDLGVLMPLRIARKLFVPAGAYRIHEPELATPGLVVRLHWSKRFEHDPAHAWMRALLVTLFTETHSAAAPRAQPA